MTSRITDYTHYVCGRFAQLWLCELFATDDHSISIPDNPIGFSWASLAEAHRGRVVGLYYLIRGMITIPAPFLGGLLWWQTPSWPLLLGGAISGLSLLLYAVKPRLTEQMT